MGLDASSSRSRRHILIIVTGQLEYIRRYVHDSAILIPRSRTLCTTSSSSSTPRTILDTAHHPRRGAVGGRRLWWLWLVLVLDLWNVGTRVDGCNRTTRIDS